MTDTQLSRLKRIPAANGLGTDIQMMLAFQDFCEYGCCPLDMMISVLSRRLTKQWIKFSKNDRGFCRGASWFWAILQTTYKRLIASFLIERNPIRHRLTTDTESLRDFAYGDPFGQPKKSLGAFAYFDI